MFFEMNNKTYGVNFSRFNTTTYAELVEITAEGVVHLGVMGVAFLHPNDRFNKSTGRKVALANLLDLLSSEEGQDVFPELSLNRDSRTAIWARYFETHRKD